MAGFQTVMYAFYGVMVIGLIVVAIWFLKKKKENGN